jgi:hypothetical protein
LGRWGILYCRDNKKGILKLIFEIPLEDFKLYLFPYKKQKASDVFSAILRSSNP